MLKQTAAAAAVVVLASAGAALGLDPAGQTRPGGFSPRVGLDFVNWETPHVHPLEMTPDGTKLLAVNTADARLEVFTLGAGTPRALVSIPVGLDPVSVRARSNTEVWVTNRISDSISIVDLTTRNVVRTLKTADEPCDVVFAGSPRTAFVSCSHANAVQVFNLANLDAAPSTIAIAGESPRALATSPDGQKVYVAIFNSGNHTTILGGGATAGLGGRLGFPLNVVGDPLGPYGGINPPPNNGTVFNPLPSVGLPTPPAVGLIVRKNAAGNWMDDNAHDWTSMVSGANASHSGRPAGWDLMDNDLAVIDTLTLGVSYAKGLMNICMAVGVNPATGVVTVVGTEATNQIRFEPILKGKFTHVMMASVNPANLGSPTLADLNPHLTYDVQGVTYVASSVPMSERLKSIGDPRGIAWNAAGTKGYVAGMGSNCVIVINPAGGRAGLTQTINVGEGPTGVVLDEARGQMYVLNKFAASVSVVSLSGETESARVSYYDPSPAAIKIGRKHLYDTRRNSGLGQISCGSCHVDSRMDRLSWDLGDPSGAMQALGSSNLGFGFPGLEPATTNPAFQPFHPMKGPMTTQTLQDIIGQEPLHWRADRSGIEAFAGAFQGLQGGDVPLPSTEMQEFENFLATVTFPPNPNRNFDNTLPSNLPLPGHYTTGRFAAAGVALPNGNANNGIFIYRSQSRLLDANALSCVTCHTLPTGAGTDTTRSGLSYVALPVGPNGEHHRALVSVDGSTNVSIKIPHLRNILDKTGFNATQQLNIGGFGYLHDGSVDSIERFVSEPVFTVASDQEVADLTAFMLSFAGSDFTPGSGLFEPPGGTSKDTHAAVGTQTTLMNAASPQPGQITLITSMITLANSNKVGLVVKGRQGGVTRGYTYVGASTFQTDHAGQTITAAALQALATPGSELTYTVVPKGTEIRIGIDRDADGVLDFDEPVPCVADVDNGSGTGTPDGGVTIDDLLYYLAIFDLGSVGADVDDGSGTGTPDGGVTIDDLLYFLLHFNLGC